MQDASKTAATIPSNVKETPIKIALNPEFMMDVRDHLWNVYKGTYTEDQFDELATHIGKAIIRSIVTQHKINHAIYAIIADE